MVEGDVQAPVARRDPSELVREAVNLRRSGRLDEAIALLREVVAVAPGDARVRFRLGNALGEKGSHAEAEQAFRASLDIDPDFAPAAVNLAALLDAAGNLDAAIAILEPLARRETTQPEVHNNLSAYFTRKGRLADAERAMRQLVALRPADAGAITGLATSVHEQGRFEEAVDLFFEALAIRPDAPDTLNGLCTALAAVARYDAAEAACARALALRPGDPESQSNLAFVNRERGDIDRAIAIWRDLLVRTPDHAVAQSSLALALLARGEYEEGWRLYEWRFRTDSLAAAVRNYPQPIWDGRDPAGRTILLDAEQGVGDAIQFLRYAEMLAARGATVIAEAPRRLHRLFGTLSGVSRLIDPRDPRPDFDCHAPLMSLPHLCGTTLETVPCRIPYLKPEPALVERWRARLADLPRPWIGLCWQGNPHHRGDRWRSIGLAALAPLVARTGGTFVSLQKGAGSEQVAGAGFGARLADWSTDIDTGEDALVDTAALMALLNLTVTVDTAIVHLAGALGAPAALMLGHVPDFRWLLERRDSPWYPGVALYRQRTRGDWQPVVAAIGDRLERLDGR